MFGLKQMYVPFLVKGLVFLNIWFLFEIISNLSYGVFNIFVFMKSHFVSVKKIKSRIKILTFSLLVCPLIEGRIQNIRSIWFIAGFWRINPRNVFPNAFGPIRDSASVSIVRNCSTKALNPGPFFQKKLFCYFLCEITCSLAKFSIH